MEHYLNVCDIKGNEVAPVDVITFGSPCFPKGTLVSTMDGYKPIEEISVGDVVLSHQGTWETVVNAKYTGNKQCLKLKAMGLEEIIATPNHQFYIRKANGEIGWCPLGEVTVGDYVGVPEIKTELNPLEITPAEAWLIGRYIADGYIRDGQRPDRPEGSCYHQTVFCIGDDKRDEFESHLNTYKFGKSQGNNCTKYIICDTRLFGLCKLCGKGAINKCIPPILLNLPKHILSELIWGYISGDGSLVDGKYTANSISRNLIYSVGQAVVKSLNVPYSVYKTEVSPTTEIEGRTVNQHPYYSIRFKLSHSDRDQAFYDSGYVWLPVREMCADQKYPVYDLTVADKHSFCVFNIAVHNCQDLSLAGKRRGMHHSEMGDDDTTRSGLFMEAIRIIREMRESTQGKSPRYAVWENVCFHEDTLITCANGYRRIKDVEVGDYVKTHTGNYRPVMKVHQTKGQNVLKLHISGGEDLIVTPNHPILSITKIYDGNSIVGHTDPVWVRADELTERHLIGYKLDIPNLPDDFITETEAWAIGRWLADGSVDLTKSNPRMFFSIGKGKYDEARAHLNQLPYAIYENSPHPTAINFCFTSHEFYSLIKSAGTGAGNKQVPPYVFSLPINLQRCVLDGYVSGDGHIRTRGNATELHAVTASRKLAYGITRLIRNVYHVASNISVKPPKDGNIDGRVLKANYSQYHISACITHTNTLSVLTEDIIWQPVKYIESVQNKTTVYNLSVLDDNTYCANDVIVHNCGAYSSNDGADFQTVLTTLSNVKDPNIEIPMPLNNHWDSAGYVQGDSFSIAWRTLDAQYWGVPQRRRRIFMVADFDGNSAFDIMFNSEYDKSVVQGTNSYSDKDSTIGFDTYNIQLTGSVGKTLQAEGGGSGVNEGCMLVSPSNSNSICYGISSYDSNAFKSANPHSGIYVADTARTLDLNGGNPACNQGGICVCEPKPTENLYCVDQGGGKSGCNVTNQTAPTLTTTHQGEPVICEPTTSISHAQTPEPKAYGMSSCTFFHVEEEGAPTLMARDYKDPTLTCYKTTDPNHHYIVRRLTPLECCRLQGMPDGWTHLNKIDDMSDDDLCFWNNTIKTKAEIEGKFSKPKSKQQLIDWYNKLQTDSAEYKAYGNGMALPCVLVSITGIAQFGAKTMASLFDGIGGFPLAGRMNGVECLWTSEIELFPIAVTKQNFS